MSGAGGLIRYELGNWLFGFKAHLGICSNIVGELGAVRSGLLLARSEGFREVICESDAQVVIEFIKSAVVEVHPLGSLIADIRCLLARDCAMVKDIWKQFPIEYLGSNLFTQGINEWLLHNCSNSKLSVATVILSSCPIS